MVLVDRNLAELNRPFNPTRSPTSTRSTKRPFVHKVLKDLWDHFLQVFYIQTRQNQQHQMAQVKISGWMASLTSFPTLALVHCLYQGMSKPLLRRCTRERLGIDCVQFAGDGGSSTGALWAQELAERSPQRRCPVCSTCGELHKQGGDQTVHIEKRSQKVQPIRNAQLHLHNQLFAKEAALQLPGNLD